MILRSQGDVTTAVLAEVDRLCDPRFKEVSSATVRHLHAFVREAQALVLSG